MCAQGLLDVRHLQVRFGAGPQAPLAVDDISFSIRRGEVVALVGESGSGKSVTAKSIMRLIEFAGARVTGGEILLHDMQGQSIDLLRQSERDLRRIRGNRVAMIFQEPMTSLNPVLTIGFQLQEAILHHRQVSSTQARQAAVEALARVRIPEPAQRLQQYPHELSGGMRQRVMIAMALCCEPELLIADEPTTALDVTVQAEILALLRTIQRETGMAMLFITHDMGVVAEIADSVVVMLRGKQIESGPVLEMFSERAHDYTRSLVAAAPKLGHGVTSRCVPASPRAAQDVVLSVQRLTKYFPVRKGWLNRHVANVHAVDDVSFDLRRGETLSIVGESGSGKSTTARAILRLLPSDSGAVYFEGQRIGALDHEGLRKARRGIQMIFQDPLASLNPRKTMAEIVAEPLRIHRQGSAAEISTQVEQMLHRVGLGADFGRRYAHQLSGGQRQRVCIARALVLRPRVLVADEPVSALDVAIQQQILDLMGEIQREFGVSLLFISHDMAVVERVSDRIGVMYMGEIIEIGPAAAVLGAPRHPYTQRLLDAVPVHHPQLRGERMIVPRELNSPVYALGQARPPSRLVQVGPDHYVRRLDDECAALAA